MRFSWGETSESRRWRAEQWRIWFAWYPVTVGTKNDRHQWAWLEHIKRRGVRHEHLGDVWWTWEYQEDSQ